MPVTEQNTIAAVNMDGLTILRFTHATERRGGVEQYLDDVNRALLQRNRMTIIQLYMPVADNNDGNEYEKLGRGVLIKVPMTADRQEDDDRTDSWSIKRLLNELHFKEIIRDTIVYNSTLQYLFRRLHFIPPYSRYTREPVDVKDKLYHIFEHHNIDLIVIHSAGGRGSSEVISHANYRNIPYLIFNHFSNDRFKISGFREQVPSAAGVGGVSDKKIPGYLRNAYRNLSDGIDTNYYKNEGLHPSKQGDVPIILLPARVVPGKGHRDLIDAARILKRKDFHFKILFAGRISDVEFKQEIQKLLREYELSDRVNFVGELTQEDLRGWYAASKVVVLPSEDEGLGRVLLEAQSMGVPVIAYDVGGVSEAVLDGITGYLVRKGNIDNLASRIYELLKDDQMRESMGKAGRSFVEKNFSHAVLAKRHEEWYLNALELATLKHHPSIIQKKCADAKVAH